METKQTDAQEGRQSNEAGDLIDIAHDMLMKQLELSSSFTIPEKEVPAKQDSAELYKELSGNYDIRNPTFEEIIVISNALYAVGEISLKEHSILTFDFGRATDDLKRYAPGYISPSFDMYETATNSNSQRDWIAEIGARASSHFNYGNLVGYQMNSKILAVLQKLDSDSGLF